jgi:hypothetical protein
MAGFGSRKVKKWKGEKGKKFGVWSSTFRSVLVFGLWSLVPLFLPVQWFSAFLCDFRAFRGYFYH